MVDISSLFYQRHRSEQRAKALVVSDSNSGATTALQLRNHGGPPVSGSAGRAARGRAGVPSSDHNCRPVLPSTFSRRLLSVI